MFKAAVAITEPVFILVDGCDGQALSIQYDLNITDSKGVSWIVAQVSLSSTVSITPFTHIRIAMKGENLNSHEYVEIKPTDRTTLHAVTLESMTDLPVWRPIYIDLRELTGTGLLDLTKIPSFEIAIHRCNIDCEQADFPSDHSTIPSAEHTGTLLIDECAFVDLKPGATHRLTPTSIMTVTQNLTVAQLAATSIAMIMRSLKVFSGRSKPNWSLSLATRNGRLVEATSLHISKDFIIAHGSTLQSAIVALTNLKPFIGEIRLLTA
ncbi:MAG: hypothetical protein ACI9EW_001582 [Cellvibrionaceae bacterium]